MDIANTLLVAAGLGADAMSVCVAVGVRWNGPRQKFRLAWHMGLFQFLMPPIGWFVGMQVAGVLAAVGTYIAAALVFGIGAKMLYEVIKHHHLAEDAAEEVEQWEESHASRQSPRRKDPTRGWSLMTLCIATSLDALVVGFSLGIRSAGIWGPSLIIGLVAGLMALTGVVLGKRFGDRFGWAAEVAGAILLMGLAVSFLLT